jgi:hypothetical protein
LKKILLMLSAAAAFGLAACGPGGDGDRSPTTTGAPQITGPLTTGDPGSSLPLGSPGEMDDQMDDDLDDSDDTDEVVDDS